MRFKVSAGCWLLPIVIISLTACGFQLQGKVTLDERFERIHLVGLDDRYDVFAEAMKQRLRASGATLTDRGSATAVVRLDPDEGRRVLTVASDGQVSEYELYFRVRLEVVEADNETPLLEEQTLVLTRDVVFDEVQVLGNQAEQALLTEEMKQDMVRLVMYRLRALRT